MAWSKLSGADNKPRYIRKEGNFVVLTKDKSRATEDAIPNGWEVITLPSKHLKLRKKTGGY